MVPLLAQCPAHGRQEFVHLEAYSWWECPHRSSLGCDSVILEEEITPDGAEVIEWPVPRRMSG